MKKEDQTAGMSDESIGIFLAVLLLVVFASAFYKMGFDAANKKVQVKTEIFYQVDKIILDKDTLFLKKPIKYQIHKK